MSTEKNSPISVTKYDAIPSHLFIYLFIVPCFTIWGNFPRFRVLGFGVIFRGSGVPRFRLLGSAHVLQLTNVEILSGNSPS